MDTALFERILHEGESTALDFKQEQYAFAKASDEEKSELLKDIIGFANAWRRTDAFILVGVKDVQGERGEVVGVDIASHLPDHSLQQFVNNLTNRPVRFHYEAFRCEGKQIGVIRIDADQARPIVLKKDYGKLAKDEVYVRRGSSTDPTKPASPDEIALMGQAQGVEAAQVTVEFADTEGDSSLGTRISWQAEFCEMPDAEDIPQLSDPPRSIPLPGGRTVQLPSLSSAMYQANPNYYRELAHHAFFHRLFRRIRFVVTNVGKVSATDVRVEFCIQKGDGITAAEWKQMPDLPDRRRDRFAVQLKNLPVRTAFRRHGEIDIETRGDQIKIECDCGSLQPGRSIWTDYFYAAVGHTGQSELKGHVFAANLPLPHEFALAIDATISRTAMTVDDILALDRPNGEDD